MLVVGGEISRRWLDVALLELEERLDDLIQQLVGALLPKAETPDQLAIEFLVEARVMLLVQVIVEYQPTVAYAQQSVDQIGDEYPIAGKYRETRGRLGDGRFRGGGQVSQPAASRIRLRAVVQY